MRTILSLLGGSLLLLCLGLSGCGGADVNTHSTTTTVSEGQQLIDLQKAYKAGAITKEQYEEQKQKILNQ